MKRTIRRQILPVLFFLSAVFSAYAGGGDDHTHAPDPTAPAQNAPAGAALTDVFIATAVSETFEAVLKYAPITPGKVSALRFYLSDFYTNEPIKNAQLSVEVTGGGNATISKAAYVSPGTYLLSGTFPDAAKYSLEITITAGSKSEMVSMPVEAGKELPAAQSQALAADDGMNWTLILMIIGGVLLLGLLAFFLKRKNITVFKKKVTEVVQTTDTRTLLIISFIVFGAASITFTAKIIAHGGEDHGDAATMPASPPGAEIMMPKETQFLLGVRTQLSDAGLLNRGISVTGKVVPTTQGIAEVSAPQPGKITVNSPLPAIGAYVRKGQVLAVLEQTLAASERIAATTELIQLRSELGLAQRELERIRQLQRFISKKEVEIAEARVRAASAAIASYEKLLSGGGPTRYEITAPVAGQITKADVTRGEQVDVTKVLFEITNLDKVWVEGQISEIDIASARLSRGASFTVPAYPGEIFYGTLFTIGDVLNEQSRTVQAFFDVNNPGRLLKIGMLATVTIDVGQKSSAILVPKDAVIDVSGKPTVFVHTTPEGFVPKTVHTGSTDGKMIEIVSGLDNGERVVVTGNYQLKLMALGI